MPIHKKPELSIKAEKELEILYRERVATDAKIYLLALMAGVDFEDENETDDISSDVTEEEEPDGFSSID